MAELAGGAALVATFKAAAKQVISWIGKLFLSWIGKALKVKSTREEIKSFVEKVTPIIREIEENNETLGRRNEETELVNIQASGDLANEEIPWYKFYLLPGHQEKLQKEYENLVRDFSVFMQSQIRRDLQEVIRSRIKNDGKWVKVLCGPPPEPDFTVGLDRIVGDLKVELLRGGTSVLVLTGIGGLGKTTLAIKLCWDAEVRGKFGENIFFLTFSRTPNVQNMIHTVFDHCGIATPGFQSDQEAINRLGVLLGQILEGPILLVLDDVWPGSISIVKKFRFRLPSDYKIVVTSRVANPGFGTPYRLQPLNEEDALKLFRHHAQLNDSGPYINEDRVKQIVRAYKNSTLALEVIGGLFCKKSIDYWKTIEESLKVHSILDYDADLRTRLQNTIDMLDDRLLPIKECFMDLGLFPDDQRIPVAALIDMWAELYNLDEDGMKAMAIIHELTTGNLVKLVVTRDDASDSDKYKYYNYHFVKQHDLLRDLAIFLSRQKPLEKRERLIIDARGNNFPQWWLEEKQQGIISRVWSLFPKRLIQKQQQVDAHAMSISIDKLFTSDWNGMRPDAAKVLVINLQKKYSFPEFIEKMKELAVLIVTNYDFQPSEFTNFQLLSTLSNLKSLRLEKVAVPFFCKMKNLLKLSLYMCNVNQAFESLQMSSALPNLVEMNIDYCNDLVNLRAELSDIAPLKKLSITNCHKFSALPQNIGNLKNLEVLRLNSCTGLVGIPNSIGRLLNLSFIDISDCISIGKLPEEIGDLFDQGLIKLCIRGCLQLVELPVSVLNLKDLKNLITVICDEERSALWEHLEARLDNLNIKKADVVHDLKWLPVVLS